jgi:hypothetical protein
MPDPPEQPPADTEESPTHEAPDRRELEIAKLRAEARKPNAVFGVNNKIRRVASRTNVTER